MQTQIKACKNAFVQEKLQKVEAKNRMKGYYNFSSYDYQKLMETRNI